MATGNDLFLLISRLGKTEKRYFTQKTRFQKKEALYKKLFDLLNELEEYNKEDVLDRLGGDINKAKLLERERYLYNRIMFSLKEYHAKKHIIIQINDLFLESKILYDKGLYKVALKKLDKAENIANEYDQSAIILEILPFKAKVMMEIEKKALSQRINSIYEKVTHTLSTAKQETTYRYLNTIFLTFLRAPPKDGSAQNEMITGLLENLYQEAIKYDVDNLSSFYAQYYYYSMQAVYAMLHKEYLEAARKQQQVVQLWKNHPGIIAKNLQSYITQLANYIVYLGYCGQYDKAFLQIKVMEDLVDSEELTRDVEGELFQNIYFYKQQIYLSTEQYVKAKGLIPGIKEGLKYHAKKINPARKLVLYYNTAITFWLNGDNEPTNEWLLKIRNTNARSSDIRVDVRRFANWIQLAVFYELDSDEPLLDLSNKLRAVNRTNIPLNSFEKIVLKYFKQLMEVSRDQKEISPIFGAFSSELEALPEKEKKVLGYREYCIWVANKVSSLINLPIFLEQKNE